MVGWLTCACWDGLQPPTAKVWDRTRCANLHSRTKILLVQRLVVELPGYFDRRIILRAWSVWLVWETAVINADDVCVHFVTKLSLDAGPSLDKASTLPTPQNGRVERPNGRQLHWSPDGQSFSNPDVFYACRIGFVDIPLPGESRIFPAQPGWHRGALQ